MKKIIKLGIAGLAVTPVVAWAANRTLKDLLDNVVYVYLDYAVFIIISLAVIMFVWNIYKYFIYSADDAEAKKEAGLYVMWSVVGFFAILSLWGLVNILVNTFNLDNNAPSGIFGTFKRSPTSGIPGLNKPSGSGIDTTTGGGGGVDTTTGGGGGVDTTN